MRILLLVSALVIPPRQPAQPAADAAVIARVSVRADSDSVIAVGILKDLAAAFDEAGRQYGYDYTDPLEGWLEPAYLASATSRPDIAEHFLHKQAYAAFLGTHMDSIVTAVVQRRLDAAGMPVMQQDEVRAAFLRGFHKNGDKQRAMLEAMARQARVALTLHDFLVKIDARVALDPKTNTLVFDRPIEQRRYNELAIAIDAANDILAQTAGQ